MLRVRLAVACIAGFSASLILNYPGFMNDDSVRQVLEARSGVYSNWHPPIMAFTWHLIEKIVPGPFGMLVFQTALIWSGTFLVSVYWFKNSNPSVLAFSPCLLIFFPPIFGITGALWKDVFMLGFLILAIGIAGGIKGWSGYRNLAMLLFGSVFSFAAMLFRYNGLFAVVPLIALGVVQATGEAGGGRQLVRASIIGVIVFSTMLVGVKVVNDALTTVDDPIWVAPALFDIAGVIHGTADAERQIALYQQVPSNFRLDKSSLDNLLHYYSPERWESLIHASHPAFVYQHLTEMDKQNLIRAWYSSVVSHPLAWFSHRMRVFRYNVAFNSDVTVPIYMYPHGISVELLRAYGTRNPDLNRLQRFVDSILTGMSQLVLFKPWIYLIICISVIITCVKFSVPKKREIALITGSGLTHALGVFLFAPAPDYRYSHYTVYVGTLGLILLLRAILLTEQRIISRGTRLKIITSPARI